LARLSRGAPADPKQRFRRDEAIHRLRGLRAKAMEPCLPPQAANIQGDIEEEAIEALNRQVGRLEKRRDYLHQFAHPWYELSETAKLTEIAFLLVGRIEVLELKLREHELEAAE
jgi:hypothetical protein